MRTSELMKSVLAGKRFVVGTFWAGSIDPVTIRDDKSGSLRQSNILKQTVLTDAPDNGGMVIVGRWLKDTETPESVRITFKRGDKVCGAVIGERKVSGIPNIDANLELLTD